MGYSPPVVLHTPYLNKNILFLVKNNNICEVSVL